MLGASPASRARWRAFWPFLAGWAIATHLTAARRRRRHARSVAMAGAKRWSMTESRPDA